jgi:hypothetical protein
VIWNRRGRLVFPQLAERTTNPMDDGFMSRTLFRLLQGQFHGGPPPPPPDQRVTSWTGRRSHWIARERNPRQGVPGSGGSVA